MGDSTDSNMLKWWAQYTESTGDMNGALKIYQKAEDWFSQVNKIQKKKVKNVIFPQFTRFLIIFTFDNSRCEFFVSLVIFHELIQ